VRDREQQAEQKKSRKQRGRKGEKREAAEFGVKRRAESGGEQMSMWMEESQLQSCERVYKESLTPTGIWSNGKSQAPRLSSFHVLRRRFSLD
jgi:hypothetical protein